jgi:uncharacterized damage-inducible protein DinB
MKNYFIQQLQYNHWANAQLIEALQSLAQPPERAMQLLAHILSIENNWLKRLGMNKPVYEHFPSWSLQEIKQHHLQHLADYTICLDSIHHFETTIEVTLFNETAPRTLTLTDAFTHIFSHSNYHRAQIVTLLKGHVEPLPFITYIVWASKQP